METCRRSLNSSKEKRSSRRRITSSSIGERSMGSRALSGGALFLGCKGWGLDNGDGDGGTCMQTS